MKRIILLIVFALALGLTASAATNAVAVAQFCSGCHPTSDASGNITLTLQVTVIPLGGGAAADPMVVRVVVARGDSAATMLTNITTGIVNAALSAGFTVARTDVLIQSFTRGN